MKIPRIYETVKTNPRFDVATCNETSKLKTENLFLLKTLIWCKIYRVVNRSMNMGVAEIMDEKIGMGRG